MKSKTQTRRKVEKPKVVQRAEFLMIDDENVSWHVNPVILKYFKQRIRRAINRAVKFGQQSVKGKRGNDGKAK